MAGTMTLPPGFRFHPTDDELVGYYLKRRVDNLKIELEVIPVIDLYKFEPWELPGKYILYLTGFCISTYCNSANIHDAIVN
jgi:hypothetical protein